MEDINEMDPLFSFINDLTIGVVILSIEDSNDPKSLTITAANKAAYEMSGFDAQSKIGKRLYDVAPQLYETEYPKKYAEAIQSGKKITFDEIEYGDDTINRGHYKLVIIPLDGHSCAVTFQNITEIKETEKKLRLAEGRSNELLSSISDGFFSFDKEWRYIYLNKAAEKLLGKNADELLGKNVWEVFPEYSNTSFANKYREVMDTRIAAEFTDYVPRLKKWYTANIYPAQDGIAIYFRDVTDEKIKEEQLQKSETYYHALIDSLPLQVWTALPDGKLDYVNKQVMEYFQKAFAQMIGEGWQNVIHAEDLPEVIKIWTHSLQTGQDYQVEFRLKCGTDNQYRWHVGRAVPFRNAEGNIQKWFGANSDIQEFKESEQRFRQIAEYILEVFWMTDPTKNTMIYISPAYEKIWGYTIESLYNNPKQWIDAILPEDRERIMEAATKKQVAGTYNEEYRIRRNDGTIRWIHDRAFPIKDNQGSVYRIVGIATDITEQKEAQKKIQEHAVELEKINNLMVGRELKMIELKKEIEALRKSSG
jgi:PAS domain S-box-containing protein